MRLTARAHPILRRAVILCAVTLLAGCAIAKPRTDDPWESFNRKTYAFNNKLDKAVIRPIAVGYRKVTSPPVRRVVNDFFTNLRLPITIANDVLQARPKAAVKTTGRFLVNLTVGFGGLFDPASKMGLPLDDTDFGVTLARWGVADGPFIVLPFFGPSTARDFWKIPVDGYYFDPISIYARNQDLKFHLEFAPQFLYLVSLRARAIDAEDFLQSAYDPYVFVRDAYRQQRVYKIYHGDPPAEVIEQLQGLNEQNFDPDKLLEEQHAYENKQKDDGSGDKNDDHHP